MKKKIIALIMIIPLIFLITIFSVGKVASILADIPVSGIRITTQNDEGFIYLDMAKYNAEPDNFIYMRAQVEPANANNQKYTFKIDAVEEESAPADIEIDEESGLLTLNSTGKAKITAVSADKGYTDSVVVSVMSTKVVELEPEIKKITGENMAIESTGKREYETTLYAGEYQFTSQIYPVELSSSSVSWSTSDKNVIDINPVTGVAQAKLSGEAIITLDGENVVEGFEPTTIKVNVPYLGGESGMVIEGKEDNELMFDKGVNKVSFLLELENPLPGLGESVFLGITGNYFLSDTYEPLDNQGKRYLVTLTLEKGHPDIITLKLGLAGRSEKSTLVLAFTDFKFNIYTSYHLGIDEDIYQRQNSKVTYVAVGEPSNDNVIYGWSCSDMGLNLEETAGGLSVNITANSTGNYSLLITAYEKVIDSLSGEEEKGEAIYSMTKNIHVVRGVYSVDFVNKMGTSDSEGLLTLGDTILDESGYKRYYPELKLKVQYDDGSVGGYNMEDLVFSGADNSIVAPFATPESFKVWVNGDGISTIVARWSNGENLGVDIKSTLKIRAVKDGVMVGATETDAITDYRHLKRAGAEGKKVILMRNVMLGWSNMTTEELKEEVKDNVLLTEFDWTYYKNRYGIRPSVYYLVEFSNDVFGNGFVVNAENFTTAKDSVGNSLLFKGPLNFVAIDTAAVKAQDNICFLVREDDVTINNVELLGCSNEKITRAPEDGGGLDLTLLNYVGTVLEISGNTTLLNSRLSNGRTVVRIFGGETTDGDPIVENYSDVNVQEERVFAHIESCRITQGREFLLKLGSNRAVKSEEYNRKTEEFITKQPTKEDGTEYALFQESTKTDKYFYDNYVITDVTLKNSVLATSGVFAIGVETHFNGEMLDGDYGMAYWDNLGSNSFASVLRLEGDVKIYDWKDMTKVDSSTLIETTNTAMEFLKLQIDLMLEKVASVEENGKIKYPGIITRIGETGYVHAGICFYGGGHNYSYVVTDNLNTEMMTNYRINLSVLRLGEEVGSMFDRQAVLLPQAAGYEDFSFYMYDSNSDFTYEKQQSELSSGQAYILPIAPVEGNK